MSKKSNKDYGTGAIRQLKGLEAVRERPGMYLGDPSSGDALHHLIWEVVDNSVDEHLANYCDVIRVRLMPDGWAEITDNGRGIPVGIHEEEGRNTLEMVMTSLHTGGKFDHDSYEKSAGLHGVGVAAVNAVSSECQVYVRRDGTLWMQAYEAGMPITDVEPAGSAEPEDTGTTVRWLRDLTIFSDVVEYDRKLVAHRMEELAFLNPGLTIFLEDSRGRDWSTAYRFDSGITEYLERRIKKQKVVVPVLHFRDGSADTWNVEIAMAWTMATGDDVRCYANNTYNADGGTHLTGFRSGLTRAITAYAAEHNLLKGLKDGITGTDIRDGLVAVVNTRLRDVAFSSQTKDKLVTPKARTLVEELFKDQVEYFLEHNPGTAKKIAEKAVLNAKAREAARRARDEVMRKDFTDRLSLPGKLSDCASKKPSESELFVVEGDSAGGSAKGARDRAFQAILPLRGKVLNVERVGVDTLLSNEAITTLVTALGCGIEQNRSFNIKKLRYHKIILTTDADVDGAHIRTLLLTFFYRCMPRLIWGGYVYIAMPPLYGVRFKASGRPEAYFSTDDHLAMYMENLDDSHRARAKISRYKGLGEMNPEELWVTTLNPESRTLRPVSIDDAVEAERAFDILMGANVDPRREWIEANARFADDLDV